MAGDPSGSGMEVVAPAETAAFARHAYSLEVPRDHFEPRKKRVKTQGVIREGFGGLGRHVPPKF